jgi:hypothetical protein
VTNKKNYARHLEILAAMSLLRDNSPEIKYPKAKQPWHNYPVPKSMRKGKMPDEIQALRKELWEKQQVEAQ